MAEVLEFKPVGQDAENKELDVRLLTDDEVESLRPAFVEADAIFPNPAVSFFVGAVEPGGRVVAFLCFQLQVHAEPMKIDHPYEAVFKRLIDVGEKALLDRIGPCLVYAFTPAGKVTQLAAVSGMKLEPWNVMSKVVLPSKKEII